MDILDLALMPIITLIVYWIIELVKQITNNNENFKRFIPLIACGSGIVLGLLIFFTLPQMFIANNWLYAIVVGGASGLAATGSNQILKQLKKYKTDKTPNKEIPLETEKNDKE